VTIYRVPDLFFDVEKILKLVKYYSEKYNPETIVRVKIISDLPKVTILNNTLYSFLVNGTSCIDCGIAGKYFVLEKHGDRDYTLNLYGTDEDDNEVMLTKDHIKRKRVGGNDAVTNLETRCLSCNNKRN